jgi:hypothetical protein
MKLVDLPDYIKSKGEEWPFGHWREGLSHPDLWAGCCYGFWMKGVLDADQMIDLLMQLKAAGARSVHIDAVAARLLGEQRIKLESRIKEEHIYGTWNPCNGYS